jgi:short-subunit dehydrogenase
MSSITLKPIDQQVVVITGATSGIGLATAELAVHRGAKVVLAGRSQDVLAAVVEAMEEAGGTAVQAVADVANRQDVERIAEIAIRHFGRIDSWVNNAGVSIYGRLEEVRDEDSRRLFDTNFWGVVNGSLTALPHLKRSGGALINVGSEVSEAVVPLQGMYTASKHAVKGFTDALRVELEADHAPVSVTLIQPTAVDTPFPQRAKNYTGQEPKLPEPRIDPGQVAEAILDAMTTSRRDVKVGMMAKMNTAMSHLLPGLSDRMAAKQMERQHYQEPPRRPEGTLHAPGEAGHTHGSGGRTA